MDSNTTIKSIASFFALIILIELYNSAQQVETMKKIAVATTTTAVPKSIESDKSPQTTGIASKPIAIVHVGPHKTGSSTIQQSLVSKRGSMEQDNYLVYPKEGRNRKETAFLAHCFVEDKSELHWVGCTEEGSGRSKKRDDVVGEFESFVQSALDENQNIILSSEEFDFPSFNFTAFQSYLVPSFQVKVVMTYRRFYDYFISFYNQMLKNGQVRDENNFFLSFGDWVLSDDKIFEIYQSQHTYEVYERYKQYDGDLSISVMNMHNSLNEQSIVADFFCNHVSDATNTCEVVTNSSDKTENPSKSSFLDRIFIDDLYRYYNGTSDILSQKNNRAKIVEKFLNMTSFPLRCPSAELKERLLSVSIKAEKALTAESWYTSDDGIKSLMEDFEKKMNTTKFCVADVEQIVSTAEWQEFWGSLSDTKE